MIWNAPVSQCLCPLPLPCANENHGRREWCHHVVHASQTTGTAADGFASRIFCQSVMSTRYIRFFLPILNQLASLFPLIFGIFLNFNFPPSLFLPILMAKLSHQATPVVWIEVKAAPHAGRPTAHVGLRINDLQTQRTTWSKIFEDRVNWPIRSSAFSAKGASLFRCSFCSNGYFIIFHVVTFCSIHLC